MSPSSSALVSVSIDDLTTWRIEFSLTAGLKLVIISSMAVRQGSGDTGADQLLNGHGGPL